MLLHSGAVGKSWALKLAKPHLMLAVLLFVTFGRVLGFQSLSNHLWGEKGICKSIISLTIYEE